ncbi:MAG: hypothetical protein AAFQ43_01825, partial [Bacteroidota bacterium]
MPRVALALACVVALSLAGCDETPGAPDPFGAPPSITAFAFTPEAVDDTGSAPEIDLAPVITVSATSGSGDITVRAFVRDVDGVDLLAEAEASGGPGTFELRPEVRVPRGAIGDYQVTVTTEDASGRIGDRAAGVIAFSSASLGPPEVTATRADPATVTAPSSGSTIVTLFAEATDPDGVANLARVELRDPVTGETLFRFSDDGFAPDETAGDGRAAIRLSIGSGTPTGTFGFDAVAVDRSGLESAPTEVT